MAERKDGPDCSSTIASGIRIGEIESGQNGRTGTGGIRSQAMETGSTSHGAKVRNSENKAAYVSKNGSDAFLEKSKSEWLDPSALCKQQHGVLTR